jgi:hypothetical protein
MKNQIILWISSIIIVIIIGYVKSITDKDFPVTGTFGIEGKKVSYKLDKASFDKTAYKNIILSDVEGLKGKLIWTEDSQKLETKYQKIDKGLECEIPRLKPGKKIEYKIILTYRENTFKIPREGFVTLTFWGNIPYSVNVMTFIFLFGWLTLSIRCFLEMFNRYKNLKKFALINCSILLVLTSIIIPLRNSYKLGAINNFVPNILDLIDPVLLLVLFLWIAGTVLFFYKKYTGPVLIAISLSTVILFFFIK